MKAENINIVNKNRHDLSEVLPLATPYSLFVDVCNACNFKCRFCAMQYADKELSFKKMLMSFETYKKVIDDLKEFSEPLKMLRLTANGEPLLNKELPEMIQYAKEAKISEHIEIVSNGSLLNPVLNRALVSGGGLNRIRISIEEVDEDGYYEMTGTKIDWDKFVYNIQDLYENKGSLEIYIKTVDAAVQTEAKKQKFYNTFGNICDKISIEHVIPIWTGWDEIKDDFNINSEDGLHGHKIRDVEVCPFPFYSFVVNPDGEVTACCSDWERNISFGNIKSEHLLDIWRGQKYHDFLKGMLEKGRKKNHPIGCAKCEYPCYDAVDNIDINREIILQKFENIKLYNS